MRAAVAVNPEYRVQAGYMSKWASAILSYDEVAERRNDYVARRDLPEVVSKVFQAPMLTGDNDLDGLAETMQIVTSFVPVLRSASAFFRLYDGLMVKVPLRTRVTFMTGSAQIGVANEGEVIAVSRLASDQTTISPTRSTGILIFSDEMLKWLSEKGQQFLDMEIRRAIAGSVDAAFFNLIEDGSTPTNTSVGSASLAASVDMRWLFNAAGLTAESRPLLVLAPDVGRKAATLYDASGGGWAFPQMSPVGGIMCGVPAMVSDALASGEIGLLDGAGIAGDVLGASLKPARHATVQLENAPDSPTTASTTLISLWQNDLVGLMPEVYFGATRLRDTAFVKLTGVNWGSTDSPA